MVVGLVEARMTVSYQCPLFLADSGHQVIGGVAYFVCQLKVRFEPKAEVGSPNHNPPKGG